MTQIDYNSMSYQQLRELAAREPNNKNHQRAIQERLLEHPVLQRVFPFRRRDLFINTLR